MKLRLQPTSFLIGFNIVVFIAALFLTSALLFAVRVPITPFHLYAALGVTLLLSWFSVRTYAAEPRGVVWAVSLLVPAALFVVFLWISGQFYDLSYDGQSYHQEAIILLKNGWNPFYDAPLTLPTGHDIWINHYPRLSETVAAALYAVTGHIEQSKVFNFLLMAGSFFLALSALLAHNAGKTRAVALSLLLAGNPVSVYQSLGFYVDGQLASLLLCLLALSYLLHKGPNRWIVTAYSLCLMMTVNNKFTAVGYAAVFCLGLLVALYMSEKFDLLKKMVKLSVVSALIGVVVAGFNPYVTNTLRHGHPFYPLAGPGSRDVVADFTPKSFLPLNRIQRALVSYFSVTEENSTTNAATKLKVPFTITAGELSKFGEPDVAIGGFGPLFGGAIVLSLAIVLVSLRLSISRVLLTLGVLAILLASVFINSAAWWARYVPQLWFVPVVCALLGFSFERKKAIAACSWVLVAVLAVNALSVACAYVSLQYDWNRTLKSQLETVRNSPQPVLASFGYSWSNRIRFEELGIAYREGDTSGCPAPLTLNHSGTSVCTAGGGHAAAE